MSNLGRRDFLGSGTAMAAIVGLGGSGVPLPRVPASQEVWESGRDMVVLNARVFTVDVRNLSRPGTKVVGPGGMTGTPRCLDARCNPRAVRELTGVNGNVRTMYIA